MKILLITDTHLGVSQNRDSFHQNMQLFYDKVFFPFLKNSANLVDHIVHLGDVFHERKKLDIRTASKARKYFFEPLARALEDRDISCDIIAGNHDSYLVDTLDVNSLDEFVKQYSDRITIHTKPHTFENILYVPWINASNKELIKQQVEDSKADYVFGHLELAGFNFSKKSIATHGEDPDNYKGFERVLSGHYHYKHTVEGKNVDYLGSPTQQTWADANTKRGFHVFDTKTGELEFIENPYDIFSYVEFGTKPLSNPRYYKVNIREDLKQSDIQEYIDILIASGAYGVEIINHTEIQTNEDIELESIEDTPTFIKSYVNDEDIANIMVDLYNEAVAI